MNQSEPNPMPQEVLAQLNAHKRFGLWLNSQHSEEQRAMWWTQWLSESPVGRAHAEQLRQQSAITSAGLNLIAAGEAERQQEEQRRRRDHEERWQREPGEAVLIQAPQTTMHNMVGRVQRMEWVEQTYYAHVLVDPLPADHPLQQGEVRSRPVRFMPIAYRFRADDLVSAPHHLA